MLKSMKSITFVDEMTQQFRRRPDRPDGKFIRRKAVESELAKAQQRLRTAVWRDANDRRGRPTAEQIGKAILLAVCTSADFQKLIASDLTIVHRAVDDMVERGFRLSEIHDVMKKIRRRHVDSADRFDEESEDCSAPYVPKGIR